MTCSLNPECTLRDGHTGNCSPSLVTGRTPSPEHVSQLGYTTDDDGIWLTCTCGELARNLGYYPTVEQAAAAWAPHVTAPASTSSAKEAP